MSENENIPFLGAAKQAVADHPIVLVGAAGHTRPTVAKLARDMGPTVYLNGRAHQVAVFSPDSEMVAFVTNAVALIRPISVGPTFRNNPPGPTHDEDTDDEDNDDAPERAAAHHPAAATGDRIPSLAGTNVASRARVPARKFVRYPLERVPTALEVGSQLQVAMLCISIGMSFGAGIKGAGWDKTPGAIRGAPAETFQSMFQAITSNIHRAAYVQANSQSRGRNQEAFRALTTGTGQRQAPEVEQHGMQPPERVGHAHLEAHVPSRTRPPVYERVPDHSLVVPGHTRPDLAGRRAIKQEPEEQGATPKNWPHDKAKKGVMRVKELREFVPLQQLLAPILTTKGIERNVNYVHDDEVDNPPAPRAPVTGQRLGYQDANRKPQTTAAEGVKRTEDVAEKKYTEVSTRVADRG